MTAASFLLQPVGRVRAPFTSREECPKHGSDGAPEAWLEVDDAFRDCRVDEPYRPFTRDADRHPVAAKPFARRCTGAYAGNVRDRQLLVFFSSAADH